MSRVYVVHRQQHYDRELEKVVDVHDLQPAARFGELVYLLPSEASPFNPEVWIPMLHARLTDITSDDYLLLVGNPAFIAWAAGIATDYADGMLRLLQWNRRQGCYEAIAAPLFGPAEE